MISKPTPQLGPFSPNILSKNWKISKNRFFRFKLTFWLLESESGPHLKILEIISNLQKKWFVVSFGHFWPPFDLGAYMARFKHCKNRHFLKLKSGFLLKTTPKPGFGNFLYFSEMIQIIYGFLRLTTFSDSYWDFRNIRWKN